MIRTVFEKGFSTCDERLISFGANGTFNGMLLPKLKTVDGITSTAYVNGFKGSDDASGGTGLCMIT